MCVLSLLEVCCLVAGPVSALAAVLRGPGWRRAALSAPGPPSSCAPCWRLWCLATAGRLVRLCPVCLLDPSLRCPDGVPSVARVSSTAGCSSVCPCANSCPRPGLLLRRAGAQWALGHLSAETRGQRVPARSSLGFPFTGQRWQGQATSRPAPPRPASSSWQVFGPCAGTQGTEGRARALGVREPRAQVVTGLFSIQMFGNWTFGTLVFTVMVFTVTLKVGLCQSLPRDQLLRGLNPQALSQEPTLS